MRLEQKRANDLKHDLNTYTEMEARLKGYQYRVKILKSITSTPFNHRFGTESSRKKEGVISMPAVVFPLTNEYKKNLIDVMTDIDVQVWRKAGLITSKRKKTDIPDGILIETKDAFSRKRRGVWTTAVRSLERDMTQATVRQNDTVLATNNAESLKTNGSDDAGVDEKVPLNDKDVATPFDSEVATDDLEQSFVEECYRCATENRDTIGDRMVECVAMLCKRAICDVCLQREIGKVSLEDLMYYCDRCIEHVEEWEAKAQSLTQDQVMQLQKTPMDIQSNAEANIWNFYRTHFIRNITLLPPSMHPGMLVNPAFKQLHRCHPHIALLRKTELLADRKRAEAQFKVLVSAPVRFVSTPQALEVSILHHGFDTTNLTNLTAKQQLAMNYIIDHEDNHTMLTLMRNKADHTMHSVVALKNIPMGTSPTGYGGVYFTGAQMSSASIPGADQSTIWTVLEHAKESKTVYIQPHHKSNYGRFINGVRIEDTRMANLIIVKVRDSRNQIHIRFVAIRDIKIGEHLLYCYGEGYSTENFYTVDKLVNGTEWEPVQLTL
jgi:hypothetical protein